MITYLARNTRNGKFYIGSTKNFANRKKEHLANKGNFPFHRALRANPDDFEWETFEDQSEGRELEQALLDTFFGTEMCYNLCPSAICGVWRATGHCWVNDGTTEKYVEVGTLVEEGWELGRLPVSDEAKEKMRRAHTGKVRPECATAIGRVWVTNADRTEEIYLKPGEEIPEGWVKGRRKFAPRSEESRQKTSKSLKGKPKSDEAKKNIRKARLAFLARNR
jgi:predicted GIY-YIG superfamily endonuclease